MSFNNNFNNMNINFLDDEIDILDVFLHSINRNYIQQPISSYTYPNNNLQNFYDYYEDNNENPLNFIFNSFINDPLDRVLEQSFNEQQAPLERTNRTIMISSQRFESLDEQIMNNNKSCSICINDFEKDDMISITNCNHIFHTDCIKEWGKYKPDCAICREPLE
jgi:hypothetical protein